MFHTFMLWLARIHIGRWDSPAAWAAAVSRVCQKQWKHPPALPLADHIGLWERLHLRGGSRRLRFWHRASLALALSELPGGNSRRYDLSPPKDLPPSVEWGVAAFAALRGGQSYQTPWIRELGAEFLRRAEANGGTLPYSPALPGLRLVDTLWMACPFLFLYAARADELPYAALARRQLEDFIARGLHPVTGLPAHSYAIKDGTPAGVYGWGRGCGFLLLALIESAEALREEAWQAEAAWLIEQAICCAESILQVKLPGGGWPWLPGAQDRPEASATAMLGYGLARLAALLPPAHGHKPAFLEAARQAQACLMAMTRRGGAVDFAQGDTRGIGLYSARLEPMPLAQGYALRLWKALKEQEGSI